MTRTRVLIVLGLAWGSACVGKTPACATCTFETSFAARAPWPEYPPVPMSPLAFAPAGLKLFANTDWREEWPPNPPALRTADGLWHLTKYSYDDPNLRTVSAWYFGAEGFHANRWVPQTLPIVTYQPCATRFGDFCVDPPQ